MRPLPGQCPPALSDHRNHPLTGLWHHSSTQDAAATRLYREVPFALPRVLECMIAAFSRLPASLDSAPPMHDSDDVPPTVQDNRQQIKNQLRLLSFIKLQAIHLVFILTCSNQ